MDVEKVAKEVKGLRKRPLQRFYKNLNMLFYQFSGSMCLRGPYRLVVDSNIVMRLESYRNGRVTEGVLAVFLFFEFLKRSGINVDVVIRPSVFYEFSRKKKFNSVKQHWDEFKSLRDTIESELSLTPFFDGIETFQGAVYYLENINHDVELISNEFYSYQKRDWRFDFHRPQGGYTGTVTNIGYVEVPPFYAAEGLYQELGLKYFDENRVKRFLVEHMWKYICEYPGNDKNVIEKYRGENDFSLTKILKLTAKGNLSGVADVDILTLCNVHTQFSLQAHGRYYPASIGLSIDSNLSDALYRFSQIHLSSDGLIGGIDNQEDNDAKMEAFIHDQRRLQEGDERTRDIFMKQGEFFDEISDFLVGRKC